MTRDCANCGGDGWSVDQPYCPACGGTGREPERANWTISTDDPHRRGWAIYRNGRRVEGCYPSADAARWALIWVSRGARPPLEQRRGVSP